MKAIIRTIKHELSRWEDELKTVEELREPDGRFRLRAWFRGPNRATTIAVDAVAAIRGGTYFLRWFAELGQLRIGIQIDHIRQEISDRQEGFSLGCLELSRARSVYWKYVHHIPGGAQYGPRDYPRLTVGRGFGLRSYRCEWHAVPHPQILVRS